MGRGKQINTIEFIKKGKEIHGEKYNYSESIYINSLTKVIIYCSIHGKFEQAPLYHLSKKRGCFLCGIDKVVSGIRLSKEQFVKKAQEVHFNKYNYDQAIYKNMHFKIKIICNECNNQFMQEPNNHIRDKNGCPKCNGGNRLTTEEFIERAKEIHKGKNYDYSLVDYINHSKKIKIICQNKNHNIFLQSPSTHLAGGGCPKCKSSRGEQIINIFLLKNKIDFIFQKKFTDCKSKKSLPFDFYLPEKNICIEFDGIQHFKPIKKFGGEQGLIERQKSDKIKNLYCKNNNIKLIRIEYHQNVETVLSKELL